MPDIMHDRNAALFDEASGKLRGIIEELPGVSEETLEAIDWISQPRTDCPPPQDTERHEVFNRLVLAAFGEALAGQQRRIAELGNLERVRAKKSAAKKG